MSQTLLFMLFMIGELCAILILYQVIIIPRVALKTNNLFEKRMLDKTWNIPAMLEDYTTHLLGNVDALFFGYTDDDDKKHKGKLHEMIPAIISGAFGKGMEEAKKENPAIGIMDEAMEELPWYAKALLLKATGGDAGAFLGALQGKTGTPAKVGRVVFDPKFGLK